MRRTAHYFNAYKRLNFPPCAKSPINLTNADCGLKLDGRGKYYEMEDRRTQKENFDGGFF